MLTYVYIIAQARGLPHASWNSTSTADGSTRYCLQKYDENLIFEADLGFLSNVSMIGSVVWFKAVFYQKFEMKYSMDNITWNTYNLSLKFMVRHQLNHYTRSYEQQSR